jgi:hypothetical protein
VFDYWNGQGRNFTDLYEKEYSHGVTDDEKAREILPGGWFVMAARRLLPVPRQGRWVLAYRGG